MDLGLRSKVGTVRNSTVGPFSDSCLEQKKTGVQDSVGSVCLFCG